MLDLNAKSWLTALGCLFAATSCSANLAVKTSNNKAATEPGSEVVTDPQTGQVPAEIPKATPPKPKASPTQGAPTGYSPDGKINLTWEPGGSGDTSSYTVQVFKTSDCTGSPDRYTDIKANNFQFTGTSGQTYTFKIEAVRNDGSSMVSDCTGKITVDLTPPQFTPEIVVSAAPEGVAALWSTQGQAYVRWSAASDDESGIAGYSVAQFSASDCSGPPTTLTQNNQTLSVTGSDGNVFAFRIAVTNNAGLKSESGCSSPITIDTTAPTPGASLSFSAITSGSATMSWTAGTDAVSDELQYRACLAPAGTALSTVEEITAYCEAEGWKSDWQSTTDVALTGLLPETAYTGNVIARDPAGHLTAYIQDNFQTAIDDIAPVAGGAGALSVGSVTDLTADLSWTAATDNYLAQGLLEYRVCLSKTNNVATVADADANCSWQTRWARNLTSVLIDGLAGGKTYWLNVLVRDRRGNTAVYQSQSVTAAAPAANTVYVDDNFYIEIDNGAPGLDATDVVTFASGEHGEVSGLVYGTNAFATIATAYAALAPTGGRINLGTGTFNLTAQLNMDANINLVGQSAAQSRIQINYNTGGSGDARGAILLRAGRTFAISNLTVDGTGRNVHQAIRSYADPLRITNVAFNQIRFSNYLGYAVAQIGLSTVGSEIRNCYFSNIHRVGATYYVNGGSTVFRWNHYKGKGTGDYLDFAYVTVGAVSAHVYENFVEDVSGAASLDGSVSFAIWVYNLGMTQSHLLATRNEIINSSFAFAAGYGADTVTQATISKNVMNNVTWGLWASLTPTLDIKNNWWGNATGPEYTGNPGGTGSRIDDQGSGGANIQFSPWATSAWIE